MGKDKWEVKGVKSFRGHEGFGFNASLYLNGKKVALVDDAAQGGEYDSNWLDYKEPRVEHATTHLYGDKKGDPITIKVTPTQKMFYEYVESQGQHIWNADCVMAELVDAFEEQKWLKKNSKKKTLFRIKGDKKGEWRTMNAPLNERVSAAIAKKYGADKIEMIYGDA